MLPPTHQRKPLLACFFVLFCFVFKAGLPGVTLASFQPTIIIPIYRLEIFSCYCLILARKEFRIWPVPFEKHRFLKIFVPDFSLLLLQTYSPCCLVPWDTDQSEPYNGPALWIPGGVSQWGSQRRSERAGE